MFEVGLAYLAKPLIKWGIVAAIIGALTIGLFWFRHEAALAEKAAAISAEDAERWHAASDLRDSAITMMRAEADANDAREKARQKLANDQVAAAEQARNADHAELQSFREAIEKEAHAPDASALAVGRAVLKRLSQ